MLIRVDKKLVLVADYYFDACIHKRPQLRGGMLVTFRTGWTEVNELLLGIHYWVFPDSEEGESACLDCAISEGVENLDPGSLRTRDF